MGKTINIDTYKRYTAYCDRKKKAQLLHATIPLRLKLLRNRLEQQMDEETQQNKKRNQRRNKKKSPKKKQERDTKNAQV